MKAAVYDVAGGPEVFRYAEVPDPACAPDGVLIRVQAVAIEGGDLVNRGRRPPPGPNHVVGYAAAGEVVEVGAAVTHLRVGQRVATFDLAGSHAALRAVPALTAWPVPDGMDIAAAAAVPVPFGTAWYCLFRAAKLEPGEVVLVQAGASSVGLAAIQLAARAGAVVIAAIRGGGGGDARAGRLRALGAAHVVDRDAEDVADAVRRLSDGDGAAVVLDPVGGATLPNSIEALRPHGRLVFLGNAGGVPMTPDLWPAMFRNAQLLGVYLGAELADPAVQQAMRALLERTAAGELEVVLDRRFPLADAEAAHRHIEAGGVLGRVVLVP